MKTSIKLFRLVFFYAIVFCETSPAQICDKKAAIYFETGQFLVAADENKKLEKLTGLFNQKTDTFLLEIYAFTDSVASVEYNYKLATNRSKTILTYLKKNSACHFEIKEFVRGEAQPSGSNATEEGRAKNRRVDVFYLKLRGNRITIKGKGGMEIDLPKESFGPCGVCESQPKVNEVFSNEEAERQGVSLTTTDGGELITGGMMDMQLNNCEERTKREGNADWPCADVIIRIPAANYDEQLQIWKSTKETDRRNMKWSVDDKGKLEYDAKNKCYIISVNYCPGTSGGGGGGSFSGINLDKRRDSTALMALPELTRQSRVSHVGAMQPGYRIFNGAQLTDIIWMFYYSGRGSVFFTDEGVDKNKIGYKFSGIIDRYEAECDTIKRLRTKQCWCFEIPIDAYDKIIHFQKNKNYRLKIPMKYRNYDVRLFIPAADTMLQVTKVRGSLRKYAFKQPLPDTYIVFYGEKGNLNNKRGYDAQIDLSTIRIKHSRRHNYYKAKIKRRQLKKALAAGS